MGQGFLKGQGGGMNFQINTNHAESSSLSFESTDVSLTIAVSGTYTLYSPINASGGTARAQLYKNGVAYDVEYIAEPMGTIKVFSEVSCAAGDVFVVYIRNNQGYGTAANGLIAVQTE